MSKKSGLETVTDAEKWEEHPGVEMNIYSVFDSKGRTYAQPWLAPNHQVAFRSCERTMKQPGVPIADFPADYTLFRIGTFNEKTGLISSLLVHENLGNFVQFLPTEPASPKVSGNVA